MQADSGIAEWHRKKICPLAAVYRLEVVPSFLSLQCTLYITIARGVIYHPPSSAATGHTPPRTYPHLFQRVFEAVWGVADLHTARSLTA